MVKQFIFVLVTVSLLLSPSLQARGHKKGFVSEITQAIEPSLVSVPKDNETCFSPDEPCHIKLSKFIESAKTTLDIAIYDLNEDAIVHAILVQSKKIKVRVVVDERQAKGNHSAVPLLLKAGVDLRYGRQRGIMHDKFTIVDNQRLQTGSFNYTHHAFSSNQENQVYLSTPEIVSRYKARFEKMWAEAR